MWIGWMPALVVLLLLLVRGAPFLLLGAVKASRSQSKENMILLPTHFRALLWGLEMEPVDVCDKLGEFHGMICENVLLSSADVWARHWQLL
jgi:hypothetical protein